MPKFTRVLQFQFFLLELITVSEILIKPFKEHLNMGLIWLEDIFQHYVNVGNIYFKRKIRC